MKKFDLPQKFALFVKDLLFGERNGSLIGIELNTVQKSVLDQINSIEILLIFWVCLT